MRNIVFKRCVEEDKLIEGIKEVFWEIGRNVGEGGVMKSKKKMVNSDKYYWNKGENLSVYCLDVRELNLCKDW